MKIAFIVGLMVYAAVVITVNVRSGQIEKRKTVPMRYTHPEDRTQIQSPEFVKGMMEENENGQK